MREVVFTRVDIQVTPTLDKYQYHHSTNNDFIDGVMENFKIPTYNDVSSKNQEYFNFYHEKLGSLPNLYAMLAHSSTGLEAYLRFHTHKQSLSILEKEIIGIIVGAYNKSDYCLETHTMIGKLNGLSEEQIESLKNDGLPFDNKHNALVILVRSLVKTKGRPDQELVTQFFSSGYTKENFVDAVLSVGDNMITNLLSCSMQVPSDFQSFGGF